MYYTKYVSLFISTRSNFALFSTEKKRNIIRFSCVTAKGKEVNK